MSPVLLVDQSKDHPSLPIDDTLDLVGEGGSVDLAEADDDRVKKDSIRLLKVKEVDKGDREEIELKVMVLKVKMVKEEKVVREVKAAEGSTDDFSDVEVLGRDLVQKVVEVKGVPMGKPVEMMV